MNTDNMTRRTADDAGVVVTQSKAHVRLMHLAQPPNGDRTICGQYTSDRYLPPDTDVTDMRMCRQCEMTAASRNR